jgi:hypothetical protein
MRDKRARFKFRRFGVQIPGRTVVGKGFFQTFSSPSPVDSYTGSECCYSGHILWKYLTLTWQFLTRGRLLLTRSLHRWSDQGYMGSITVSSPKSPQVITESSVCSLRFLLLCQNRNKWRYSKVHSEWEFVDLKKIVEKNNKLNEHYLYQRIWKFAITLDVPFYPDAYLEHSR